MQPPSLRHYGQARGKGNQFESLEGAGRSYGGPREDAPILMSDKGDQPMADDTNTRIAQALMGKKPVKPIGDLMDRPDDRIAVRPLEDAMINEGRASDPVTMRRHYANWLSRQPPEVIQKHLERMPIGTDTEADSADNVNAMLDNQRATGQRF